MRHRYHIPAQIPGGNRAPITLLKSYIETYEATFDPWFLAAAHAIGENHLTAHRQERYYGRLWETADREFHRFTGCEQYRELYLAYARNAVDMDVNRPGTGRYLFRTPHLPPKAYAWRLSGDDYYLRRAVGGIDFATSEFHDGAGLADYMHVYARRAGTAYSLFAPYYLQFFPVGLWALEEAGHRPDPIPNHFPIHLTALDAHRPTLLIRKQEAGEPVTVKLRSWRGAMRIGARDPDREVGYEIVGPDGEAVASGMWRIGSTEEVEIPADAPAGDYRLQFATSVGLVVPTTAVDIPEVIEVPPGGSLGGTEGVFWFRVPEGTERFVVDALSRIAVWDPDGRRVWDQSDYPSDDARSERAVIDVEPGHTGRLWRITGGTFRTEPDIAHRFSVCPARWFASDVRED